MKNVIISTITDESEIDILKGKTSVYWDLIIKYDENAKNTIDLLKTNFKDKDNLYLIAKEGNKFVWFCSIDKEWWKEWYYFIREIFIEPKYQKQKIWKELMQKCINHAKEKWAIWVITQTAFENVPIQKLCEKLWFKKWNNPQWTKWITYKFLFKTNEELKIKINDFKIIEKHLNDLWASFINEISTTDTYYNQPKWKVLKIVEDNRW